MGGGVKSCLSGYHHRIGRSLDSSQLTLIVTWGNITMALLSARIESMDSPGGTSCFVVDWGARRWEVNHRSAPGQQTTSCGDGKFERWASPMFSSHVQPERATSYLAYFLLSTGWGKVDPCPQHCPDFLLSAFASKRCLRKGAQQHEGGWAIYGIGERGYSVIVQPPSRATVIRAEWGRSIWWQCHLYYWRSWWGGFFHPWWAFGKLWDRNTSSTSVCITCDSTSGSQPTRPRDLQCDQCSPFRHSSSDNGEDIELYVEWKVS